MPLTASTGRGAHRSPHGWDLANTRYRGETANRQSRAERALGMGHSPDLVAKAIVDCVKRDRDVVPVGIESTLAYKLVRGAPQPVQGLIARARL